MISFLFKYIQLHSNTFSSATFGLQIADDVHVHPQHTRSLGTADGRQVPNRDQGEVSKQLVFDHRCRFDQFTAQICLFGAVFHCTYN